MIKYLNDTALEMVAGGVGHTGAPIAPGLPSAPAIPDHPYYKATGINFAEFKSGKDLAVDGTG